MLKTSDQGFSDPLVGVHPEGSAPRRGLAIPFTLPVAIIEHLLAWLERWRQRQALLTLDDRMLRDIGLDRATVDRECRKRPWRA